MSSLSVFRPSRFARLVGADAKNISRDPTLMFAILFSMVPALAFWFWGAALDGLGMRNYGVADFSRFLLPVVISMPAFLIGWVTGFLFLEDRDDGPLLALDVTPVGKSGFIAYRVGVTMVLAASLTLVAVWVFVPDAGWLVTLALAVFVALEAVAAALVLPALARNKVEGLALTKLTNIASIFGLIAIFASPLRYLGGFVPTYWIGEILHLSSAEYLADPVIIVIGLIVHLVVVWLLFGLLNRRVG